MRFSALTFVLIAFIGLLWSFETHAQETECDRWADLDQALLHLKGETLVWSGVGSDLGLYYLYLSNDGATWSLVLEALDQLPCVVKTGTNWAFFPPDPTSNN